MDRSDSAAPRVVAADDVPAQPWRNGGGRTRELFALPAGSGWRLRLSMADIGAAGPFSSFPGVERWFAVVAGPGVDLDVDGTVRRVTPSGTPLCFDGGLPVRARLVGGATRALNLMLRGTAGRLVVAQAGVARPAPHACRGLFARVAGRCVADGRAFGLRPRSLAWFDRPPATLWFEADADVAARIGADARAGTSADPLPPPAGWWIDTGTGGEPVR